MANFSDFFSTLSPNGKHITCRYYDFCELHGYNFEPDYLEFILASAVKRNLVSLEESEKIFDYVTLRDFE